MAIMSSELNSFAKEKEDEREERVFTYMAHHSMLDNHARLFGDDLRRTNMNEREREREGRLATKKNMFATGVYDTHDTTNCLRYSF